MTHRVGLLGLAACGGGEKAPPGVGVHAPPPAATSRRSSSRTASARSPSAVILGPLDPTKPRRARRSSRPSAPPATSSASATSGRRSAAFSIGSTPAFAMNMMLNPQGMYTRHPVVKELLGEYMTQMPNLGLTQEEAREVVEYLRTTTAPSACAVTRPRTAGSTVSGGATMSRSPKIRSHLMLGAAVAVLALAGCGSGKAPAVGRDRCGRSGCTSPPGQYDEFYMFTSGGFSGQVARLRAAVRPAPQGRCRSSRRIRRTPTATARRPRRC